MTSWPVFILVLLAAVCFYANSINVTIKTAGASAPLGLWPLGWAFIVTAWLVRHVPS